jgi:glycosyltransferase involved in cell wall biosynthesis
MTPALGQPLFSVVIPTYNRAHSILPTLESVQSQTLEDFECLVVDDGSVDGDKLESVVASLEDNRFVYIRQNNAGACSARNRGIKMARGRYVALLDSDDRFLPDKLERVNAASCGHAGDILIYSRMIVERGLDRQWLKPPRGIHADERVDEYLLCTPGTIRTSTVVVSQPLARRVLFDESLPSLQDTDFAIRAANTGAAIKFIEDPLVLFDDTVSDARVSRNSIYGPLLAWLEQLRRKNAISERAYWAGRGWQCARIASYSNRPLAIRLYMQAVSKQVFPARHSLVVGAQILIPHRFYQRIANAIVKVFGSTATDSAAMGQATSGPRS